MRNKIKDFLKTQTDSASGKLGVSAYRFWKDTKLSRPTAYRLVADSSYIPTGDVLDKICSAYLVQPGELLIWFPESDTDQELGLELTQSKRTRRVNKSQNDNSSIKKRHTRSHVSVIPEFTQSA